MDLRTTISSYHIPSHILHPLPDRDRYRVANAVSGLNSTARECHFTSHRVGPHYPVTLERSGGDGEIRTHGAYYYARQVSNLLPSATRPHLLNIWCDWPESNRHAFGRQILSLLCLPIPPQSQIHFTII